MNYEKAYKAVLKTAQQWIEDGCTDKEKVCLESVFPELRESEDERIKSIIIDCLNRAVDVKYITLADRGECLAYLEKQKEQKPAEWSEEDEDMLNSCISSIEEAKENRYAYKETDGDTSYDHEIAWLKLLRNRVGKEFLQPHWKPSEEQMKAFKGYIEEFQAKAEAAVGGWNNFDVMIRLYNDLKKL